MRALSTIGFAVTLGVMTGVDPPIPAVPASAGKFEKDYTNT